MEALAKINFDTDTQGPYTFVDVEASVLKGLNFSGGGPVDGRGESKLLGSYPINGALKRRDSLVVFGSWP